MVDGGGARWRLYFNEQNVRAAAERDTAAVDAAMAQKKHMDFMVKCQVDATPRTSDRKSGRKDGRPTERPNRNSSNFSTRSDSACSDRSSRSSRSTASYKSTVSSNWSRHSGMSRDQAYYMQVSHDKHRTRLGKMKGTFDTRTPRPEYKHLKENRKRAYLERQRKMQQERETAFLKQKMSRVSSGVRDAARASQPRKDQGGRKKQQRTPQRPQSDASDHSIGSARSSAGPATDEVRGAEGAVSGAGLKLPRFHGAGGRVPGGGGRQRPSGGRDYGRPSGYRNAKDWRSGGDARAWKPVPKVEREVRRPPGWVAAKPTPPRGAKPPGGGSGRKGRSHYSIYCKSTPVPEVVTWAPGGRAGQYHRPASGSVPSAPSSAAVAPTRLKGRSGGGDGLPQFATSAPASAGQVRAPSFAPAAL